MTPCVHIHEEPTGPNAGKFLQTPLPATPATVSRRPVSLGASRERRRVESGRLARPAASPWLVAMAVVIPTFMEVLDTTIANVALALHRRRPLRAGERQRVGHHELPGRERHHPADLRLAGDAAGAAELFSAVDRRVHARLGAVRHGDQSGRADRGPRAARTGRRRIATVQPGILLDAFPPEKQGAGDDRVRRGGAARSGRSDRRWAATSPTTTAGGGFSI